MKIASCPYETEPLSPTENGKKTQVVQGGYIGIELRKHPKLSADSNAQRKHIQRFQKANKSGNRKCSRVIFNLLKDSEETDNEIEAIHY